MSTAFEIDRKIMEVAKRKNSPISQSLWEFLEFTTNLLELLPKWRNEVSSTTANGRIARTQMSKFCTTFTKVQSVAKKNLTKLSGARAYRIHAENMARARSQAAMNAPGGQLPKLSSWGKHAQLATKFLAENNEPIKLESRIPVRPKKAKSRKRTIQSISTFQQVPELKDIPALQNKSKLTPSEAADVYNKTPKNLKVKFASELLKNNMIPVKLRQLRNLAYKLRHGHIIPPCWNFKRGALRFDLTDDHLKSIHNQLSSGGQAYDVTKFGEKLTEFIRQQCEAAGKIVPKPYSRNRMQQMFDRLLCFKDVTTVTASTKDKNNNDTNEIQTKPLMSLLLTAATAKKKKKD